MWGPAQAVVCPVSVCQCLWAQVSVSQQPPLMPGLHSHWSHIRLIESDLRPASWLTQFALVCFPFHAEHRPTHTRAKMCAHKHRAYSEWGSTHRVVMKSRKSCCLGNCRHTSSGGPRFAVWLHSYCFGFHLIAMVSAHYLATGKKNKNALSSWN